LDYTWAGLNPAAHHKRGCYLLIYLLCQLAYKRPSLSNDDMMTLAVDGWSFAFGRLQKGLDLGGWAYSF